MAKANSQQTKHNEVKVQPRKCNGDRSGMNPKVGFTPTGIPRANRVAKTAPVY